ncbi:hypothetical protein L5B97_01850 [Avibacterium sp. 20-15]|uniref:hypothetical protein n=1 Tax=unclassified Avibacterium TaxID=2685287 RepID=UPI002026A0D6|nr:MULTISPECIES: hypothetical protein [unclassified Avibacterium]MCW9732239.1 hypothetical protein [Avibacterium sp. 20-15]URL04410.1 hypothetical protein L4F93_00545 [Avibacterium sp. 20-132]
MKRILILILLCFSLANLSLLAFLVQHRSSINYNYIGEAFFESNIYALKVSIVVIIADWILKNWYEK